MSAPLPTCTHRYFWDTDPLQLDVDQYPVYVIERLLEYGDLPSVRWMLRHFPREGIAHVVQTSRRLSPFSANFWALYLGLDREDVLCLSRSYQRQPGTIWPY